MNETRKRPGLSVALFMSCLNITYLQHENETLLSLSGVQSELFTQGGGLTARYSVHDLPSSISAILSYS